MFNAYERQKEISKSIEERENFVDTELAEEVSCRQAKLKDAKDEILIYLKNHDCDTEELIKVLTRFLLHFQIEYDNIFDVVSYVCNYLALDWEEKLYIVDEVEEEIRKNFTVEKKKKN